MLKKIADFDFLEYLFVRLRNRDILYLKYDTSIEQYAFVNSLSDHLYVEYNYDLNHECNSDYDIMEVYRLEDDAKLKPVWIRSEEKEKKVKDECYLNEEVFHFIKENHKDKILKNRLFQNNTIVVLRNKKSFVFDADLMGHEHQFSNIDDQLRVDDYDDLLKHKSDKNLDVMKMYYFYENAELKLKWSRKKGE